MLAGSGTEVLGAIEPTSTAYTPPLLMASSDDPFSFLDCSGHPAATVPKTCTNGRYRRYFQSV
jgi:hypothetical protein